MKEGWARNSLVGLIYPKRFDFSFCLLLCLAGYDLCRNEGLKGLHVAFDIVLDECFFGCINDPLSQASTLGK